jgi:hypothetical protein
MARSVRAEKKEIYGVFDGCNLIEIGSWDLVEGALPDAGEDGEIISLAHMSSSRPVETVEGCLLRSGSGRRDQLMPTY